MTELYRRLIQILLIFGCTIVLESCNPPLLVRQSPRFNPVYGVHRGACPTTVMGSCKQCINNNHCPGNQICCPVAGYFCCVALPSQSLKSLQGPLPYTP